MHPPLETDQSPVSCWAKLGAQGASHWVRDLFSFLSSAFSHTLSLCFSPLPAPPLIPQVKDCQVESVCVVCVCRGEAVGVKAVKRACERKEHLFFSMRPPFSPHALATHLTPPSLLKRGVRQPPRPLSHGWCSGATHTWCALWLTFHWVKCISSSETKTELITSGDERFTV